MTISNGIRNALAFLSPALMSRLRLRLSDKGVEDFMTTVTKQTLEYRERNQIIRKDFFQLLMQLRDSGSIAENDDEWQTNINKNANKKPGHCLTLQEMTAQSFVFFGAGFETSSTTQSFCLYELAKSQDIQSKVHKEIDAVLSKYGGKLTYDAINEMKYLECCIDGKIPWVCGQLQFLLGIQNDSSTNSTCFRNFAAETTIGNAAETMHKRFSTH